MSDIEREYELYRQVDPTDGTEVQPPSPRLAPDGTLLDFGLWLGGHSGSSHVQLCFGMSSASGKDGAFWGALIGHFLTGVACLRTDAVGATVLRDRQLALLRASTSRPPTEPYISLESLPDRIFGPFPAGHPPSRIYNTVLSGGDHGYWTTP